MTAPAQTSANSSGIAPAPQPAFMRRLPIIAGIIIFVVGAIIRLAADFGFKETGFDEVLYRGTWS
jgi:hypothetical protein